MIAAPQSDTRAVIDHYEELDPFYRELWGEHVHHGLWLNGRESPERAAEQLVEHVAARAGIRAGSRVCDIGSGYGATARLLSARYGAHVTALTLVPAQHAFAVTTHPGNGHASPLYLLGNWLQNGLQAEAFDVALAIESTEHMADKAGALAEARRVLRPGGRLAVCAWIAGEEATAWQVRHLLEPICREGRLAGLGTEAEYRTLLAQAGLRVEAVTDLSARVRATWAVCLRRALGRITRDARYRAYLREASHRQRVFLWTMARLWAAYRAGALRYLLFVARRP